MTLTISRAARRALAAWLTRNPAQPALRIAFAGGCSASGYRLSAAGTVMPGQTVLDLDGLTVHLDYKSRTDLDGGHLDIGGGPDDLVTVHHRAVAGGSCG